MNSPHQEVSSSQQQSSALSIASAGLAALNPAYFALVMATGIVSIAAHFLQMEVIALALFWLNNLFFVVLWILTLARLAVFPRRLLADLMDHKRSVGFFTSVAGTCVLGSQFLVIASMRPVAVALWILGIVLWMLFIYTVFTSLTVKDVKPSLAEGIHGGWLVAVVGTQAVAVLGGLLAPSFGAYAEECLFFNLVMWLGGGMLYIWIISLIFYRYTFFKLNPADLSPPYWINMGAMAISTLAGTVLIAAAPGSPLLEQILPFLKGFTLFFWATATWWIPMLVILGIWRHVYKRFPLVYDPLYWGAVFPLGMYTACTFRLANVLDIPFLLIVPRGFIYIALGAWLLTFIGLVLNLVRGWRGRHRSLDARS